MNTMVILDPFFLVTIVVAIVMIVLAFLTRRQTRIALLLFVLLCALVMTYFVLELGLVGFQVGWFLFFPYLFAFCAFVFGFRASSGARKIGFLSFAFLASALTLTLDVRFLLPQILQSDRVQALKGLAKFIYLSSELVILLCSGVIALIITLVAAVVMRIKKPKA